MASKRSQAFLYLGAATLIWGFASPIVKFTLESIDPLPFLAYRFVISGTIGMAMFATKFVKFPKSGRDIAILTIYSLLSTTIALWLLFYGLNQSGVLDLGVIALLGPLFIVTGGAIFFHDHVTKRERVGITIALLGTVFVIASPLLGNGGISGAKFTGNIYLFLYLICDAGGALLAKKLLRDHISPLTISSFAFIIAAITIIPLAIKFVGPETILSSIANLTLESHVAVFYMAIFSGTLAYAFMARGLRSIEVGEAALFAYMQPLISAPLAVLWLGETITPLFLIGATIAAAGIFIAEHKIKKNVKHSHQLREF